MSARKKTRILCLILICVAPLAALSAAYENTNTDSSMVLHHTLAYETLAKELGWVSDSYYDCGGYYLEEPLVYPVSVEKSNAVAVTSNQGFVSQLSTSLLEGQVTVTRSGQQITANRAYLYRDPVTGKLSAIDLIGNVHLREPNTLIIGKRGHYVFPSQTKSLVDILYRTSFSGHRVAVPVVTPQEMQEERRITSMTAWGQAYEFSQREPRIYELSRASYSTCSPVDPAWQVKASHIVLNKNTGRGYATHARLYIKSIPVLYVPYFNFSIDRQRKTGFLYPSVGISNQWGPYFLAPFYWNIAPNYDMTITPGVLTKRGLQLSDEFRYLTTTSRGNFDVSVLPHDQFFDDYQKAAATNTIYTHSTNPVVQSELRRLIDDSTTRRSLIWRDDSRFSDHWSSHVDFNYVSDDYYLENFSSNLNDISKNQLLQEGDLFYKSENWNFIGRLQAYQTLHPIDEAAVLNNYRRAPQLMLNGDYPDKWLGLEYFINNELTHFDIINTPGTLADLPIGNRFHVQPGISWPFTTPYFFINPRLQAAFTQYQLYQTIETNAPGTKRRMVPIFDIASGFSFNRNVSLFAHEFQQTLEPQVYYTYIPYRSQADIPNFDTTVNTLAYDQIFNYNRFTGIDRIGDANQIGVGVTTRLIDQNTGLEKVRLGVGDIVYFANRLVTLCNDPATCVDNPTNHSNYQRLSPISGVLDYHLNDFWKFTANPIWNPITKQMDNTTLTFHYQSDNQHILNLGYTYARNGDILSGISTTDPSNNLKVTDISIAWPVFRDISAMARWSQNWNHQHLQNLLYGLQYDTCCWAVRLVGGRAFIGVDTNNNNKPKYNSEFYIQFSLKGLGDIGTGNPSGLLNSISGYNTQFGQEI